MKCFSLLFGLIICNTGYGEVRYIDEEQVIIFDISDKDFNRIKIVGDRIQQVFGNESLYHLTSDTINGQIFIKPKRLNHSNPFALTVVSEKGVSQDLLLFVRNIQQNRLILKKKPKAKPVHRKTKLGPKGILRRLVRRQVMPGFVVSKKRKSLYLQKNIKLDRRISYHNRMYEAETFTIYNASRSSYTMTEKDFKRRNVLAYRVNKILIRPGEYAMLWIVTRRDK